MTLRFALFTAWVLALASFTLPWQVDAARVLADRGTGMPAQHAGAMATHAPGNDAESTPHDHGAECFWCVAMMGPLAAGLHAVRTDVVRPAPRIGGLVAVYGRLVTLDAAPRAPPAPAIDLV